MNKTDEIVKFEDILELSDQEVLDKIKELKHSYGDEITILGHHYQRSEIVELSDFRGDSLELSKIAANQDKAKYIVFCGVHFMAESAAILCRENVKVILPEMEAGCPMADMADLDQVETAWSEIIEITGEDSVIPITYMNSTADIKAFCGAHGGAICTSSNAKAVLEWAFGQGKKVLFFPDEHLGRNTGNILGVPKEKMLVFDPKEENLGGLSDSEVSNSQIILWKGFCHVHMRFTKEDVAKARKDYQGGKIVVHPESKEEVVDIVDASGSTSYIGKYVAEAEAGSTVVVGTEINFVSRLAKEYSDRKVVPLRRSLCHNMFKVTPHHLYHALVNLGKVNVITVSEDVKKNSKLALNRMLEIVPK